MMSGTVQQQQARLKIEDLADDLSALSNPQRLKLLRLLTKPHYGEELAEALGTSRQSALKHIKKLEERGFVRAMHGRRDTGPVIEYQVVPQRLFAVSIAIGDLGKLEPEGGPRMRQEERTIPLDAAEAPEGEYRPPPRAPHLLVVNGPQEGTLFLLEGDGPRWTLGRAEDRNLRITHDPFASSHHCEVQSDREGYAIVDAHSANGTSLNFRKLPKGARVPLKVGDVIGVGHTYIVFQAE